MAEIKGIPKRVSHPATQKFEYELDGSNLNFTLRIDIKKEMKDFSKLLDLAKRDVEEAIGKVK